MHRKPKAALCLSLVLLNACYSYQPLRETAPELGSRVTARLTPEGTKELTTRIGPNITYVEGRVLELGVSDIIFAVERTESSRGLSTSWSGEPVSLPAEYVSEFQRRRVSVAATTLVVGGITAGVVAAFAAFSGESSSGGTPGPPPPPQ